MFKTLKPAHDGLKVFNPATNLHLKKEGEEVEMSVYWERQKLSGDVVEVEADSASTKKDETKSAKK